MKYIASCSFGKDSLAQIILAREHNEPLDYVVYSEVMFDIKNNISGEVPEHRDFIYNVAIPKIEKEFGYKVIVVKSELDFLSEFHRVITKGEHKGMVRAFPIGFKCCINRDCKTPPIHNFYKTLKDDYRQYVGIALDEKERLKRIHKNKRKISLLEKYGYTEARAKDLCAQYGLLSPIYNYAPRNGCWFCPNQRWSELLWLYQHHKDLFDKLVELQKTPNKASEKWNRQFTITQIAKQLDLLNRQVSFDLGGAMIKVGTICSGIGAPEKALRNLGIEYELAYFCEFDKFAAESYCAIHGVNPDKNLGDLTKVDIATLPRDLDLLVGGTPCQDFSNAGLRKGGEVGSGTRSSLMWNFVEIIRETQPKAVLWENVPGCISGEMKLNYDKFFNALLDAGYKVHSQILNAKYFGVPQSRDRVFVLAIRKDIATKFTMPTGYDCGIRLKDILEENVDEKYFLSDKQVASLQNRKFQQRNYEHTVQDVHGICSAILAVDTKEPKCIESTQGESQGNRVYSICGIGVTLSANGGGRGAKTGLYQVPHGYNKGGFKDTDFCPSITTSAFQENNLVVDYGNKSLRADGITGTITAACGGTTSNGSFGVMVENKKRELCNHLIKNGFVKENDVIRHSYSAKRMEQWEDRNVECNNMSPTLDTRCDCLGVCKDYRIRKLTPKECFMLMGFTDTDFKACKDAGISDAQLYKQAGNSIVVNVLMAIFGELYGAEWRKKVYGDWYKSEQERMADMPLLNWQVV